MVVDSPDAGNASSSSSLLSFAGDTESGSGPNLLVLVVGLLSLLFFPAAVIVIVILNRRGALTDDDEVDDDPPVLPPHLHAAADPADVNSGTLSVEGELSVNSSEHAVHTDSNGRNWWVDPEGRWHWWDQTSQAWILWQE